MEVPVLSIAGVPLRGRLAAKAKELQRINPQWRSPYWIDRSLLPFFDVQLLPDQRALLVNGKQYVHAFQTSEPGFFQCTTCRDFAIPLDEHSRVYSTKDAIRRLQEHMQADNLKSPYWTRVSFAKETLGLQVADWATVCVMRDGSRVVNADQTSDASAFTCESCHGEKHTIFPFTSDVILREHAAALTKMNHAENVWVDFALLQDLGLTMTDDAQTVEVFCHKVQTTRLGIEEKPTDAYFTAAFEQALPGAVPLGMSTLQAQYPELYIHSQSLEEEGGTKELTREEEGEGDDVSDAEFYAALNAAPPMNGAGGASNQHMTVVELPPSLLKPRGEERGFSRKLVNYEHIVERDKLNFMLDYVAHTLRQVKFPHAIQPLLAKCAFDNKVTSPMWLTELALSRHKLQLKSPDNVVAISFDGETHIKYINADCVEGLTQQKLLELKELEQRSSAGYVAHRTFVASRMAHRKQAPPRKVDVGDFFVKGL